MKVIHFLKYRLFIFILLSTQACTSFAGLNKLGKRADVNELYYNTTFIHVDSNNIASYKSNEFVLHALKKYTIASMKQEFPFLKSVQETTINRYDPSIVDTIYSFSNKRNIVRFYRAKHKDFIFIFDVTKSKFELAGAIKPGMSKAAFSQKFRIKESIDSKVKLTNSAGDIEFIFYFKRNRLKQITADIYID